MPARHDVTGAAGKVSIAEAMADPNKMVEYAKQNPEEFKEQVNTMFSPVEIAKRAAAAQIDRCLSQPGASCRFGDQYLIDTNKFSFLKNSTSSSMSVVNNAGVCKMRYRFNTN